MKPKKLTAMLSALAVSAGMASALPLTQTYAAELVRNDFEVNYDGWYESAEWVRLTAMNGIGEGGSRGMLVSGRQSAQDGASSAKGYYLYGGHTYTYSLKVRSEQAETFRLHLRYVDAESGAVTERELDTRTASAGEWLTLSATDTAPENSVDFTLTVTTDSAADFVLDSVRITEQQTRSAHTASAASSEQGLKDAFANYFRVGNILNRSTVANSAITANILKDYNSIECENEMKPDATMVQSQSSGTNVAVTLSNAASILDFCANNNIAVRGHVLVWHSQSPEWFFKEGYQASGAWVSEATMDARMESYIKNLFAAIETQYPSINLYAYDVCNEVVSDDSNRTANYGGAREPGYGDGKSPYVQIYGDNSFVEKAFTYARKYAPEDCALFYNDYNEYWDHKRDCIYEMCKSLYEKGLLDGIGMQSHINANYDGFSGVSAYTTAMQKYASIGCEVQVTELDISIEGGTYTLEQQAEKYKAVFQAAMNCENVTAVCIWGPNDANTWIKSENAPLLYDTNNQPKTAYTTLMEIVPESEWGDGSAYDDTVIEPDGNGWYFHSTYEGDLDSWTGRGDATVLTSGRIAYAGSEAMLVQERSAAWNGASRSLNTRAFVPGNAYSFSANVCYFDGGTTDTFYLKLQYTDTNGDTQYSTVAEATAVQGTWVQLANTSYTIPSDASNLQLYIETAATTNNFYVDEAIGAVAGTVIAGAGVQKLTLGDVNCGGSINAIDFSMAKQGYRSGFGSTIAQLAADVDQSGVADTNDLTLLQSYLVAEITEFPIAERVIDTAAMEQLFASISVGESLKLDGENNPLYTQRFGADPGYMVYNDRLYVYMTHDAFEYDSSGNLQENSYDVQEISCISSADLVNWTDHGLIQVAGSSGVAKWASASWAPAACHKTINGQEKFFLYFANSAGGIGVLTADSPTGPWTDPLGKALVNWSTPNCSDVVWMFDPAVFVDDDGTGYLYFGGGVPEGQAADPGTARVVKLGSDMISLDGMPVAINPPYLFEDSGINKIGDTYYYSYSTNFSTSGNTLGIGGGEIGYMTASDPMGPFTYQGILFKNPGSFGSAMGGYGNNHHSLVEFKGQYYLLYHARAVEKRMGVNLNYRTTQIDVASISNSKITVTGTMAGVAQLEPLNPYQMVQAETMAQQAGVQVSGLGDTVVTEIAAGDWIKVKGVNFSSGCKHLTVRVSSSSGAAIKVCTGSPNGTVLGYVDISAGTAMSELTVPVNSVSGTQDLCFVFSGALEFDHWQFSAN